LHRKRREIQALYVLRRVKQRQLNVDLGPNRDLKINWTPSCDAPKIS
jgi:hypothetical protein